MQYLDTNGRAATMTLLLRPHTRKFGSGRNRDALRLAAAEAT